MKILPASPFKLQPIHNNTFENINFNGGFKNHQKSHQKKKYTIRSTEIMSYKMRLQLKTNIIEKRSPKVAS
jgi:hypothetical protein